MAKGEDIQERLIEFAVTITRLCPSLPKTQEGKHIARQLLRCGTSPAPNYGEARGAESGNDFKHKLGIVLKELNETAIWLDRNFATKRNAAAANGFADCKRMYGAVQNYCCQYSDS